MPKKAQENNTATLGFEGKLWNAAELMRGKLPATQYRQVLMGLLFLRYVSDAFENRYRELKAEGWRSMHTTEWRKRLAESLATERTLFT